MRANPSLLHKQPAPDDPTSGGAWPSHRMWNWAGRGIATSRCLGMPKELENEIVQGCVGEGAMGEWIEWMAKADLPDPLDVLTKGWIPDPERLDVTVAVLISTVTWVTSLPSGSSDRIKYATANWGVLQEVIAAGIPDLAVGPASMLVTSDLANTAKDVKLQKVAKDVILKLGREGLSQFAGVV